MAYLMSLDKAKADLTDQQRIFAETYVVTGQKKDSAVAAGYAAASAHVRAHRLLNNEKVVDYIFELVRLSNKASMVAAHHTILDLCQNAESETVRLKAADLILSRSGFGIVQESRHVHEIVDSRSDQELMESIKALAAELELKTIEGEVLSDD